MMGSIGGTQNIGAYMATPIKKAQNITLRGI